MVFDELKDYLSESDLSLDYKIARSRSKKKKVYRNSRIFANSTEYSHQGMYQIDTVHRGAFCQSSFQWIYYCGSNKSTGKETGKKHLCAVQTDLKSFCKAEIILEQR